MIRPLSYNQKVIALSLLHKCILTDAIQVFGNTFSFNTTDARETLTHIQRTAIIVHGVIVEKRGTDFFVIGKDGAWDTSVPLDDEYLSSCGYSKRLSFEKAVDMLKERKFSSAA
jgi:hypothetical protein